MTNQASETVDTNYHVTRMFLDDGPVQIVADDDEVLTPPQTAKDGRRFVLVGYLPSDPEARAACIAGSLSFDWEAPTPRLSAEELQRFREVL